MDPNETPAEKRETCAACGGPMHNPTWGCVRPTAENDSQRPRVRVRDWMYRAHEGQED